MNRKQYNLQKNIYEVSVQNLKRNVNFFISTLFILFLESEYNSNCVIAILSYEVHVINQFTFVIQLRNQVGVYMIGII